MADELYDAQKLALDELARRQAEAALLERQQQEEDRKALEDRAYISRNIGQEAKDQAKQELGGPWWMRLLKGAGEGALLNRDPKYQGKEASIREDLLQEYQAQAPLRQRDLAAWEANQTRRAVAEQKAAANVSNNQRLFDIKVAQLAEKSGLDKARIKNLFEKDENLKAARKLVDAQTYEQLLENKYVQEFGAKMTKTTEASQLGREIEKNPNQVFLGLVGQATPGILRNAFGAQSRGTTTSTNLSDQLTFKKDEYGNEVPYFWQRRSTNVRGSGQAQPDPTQITDRLRALFGGMTTPTETSAPPTTQQVTPKPAATGRLGAPQSSTAANPVGLQRLGGLVVPRQIPGPEREKMDKLATLNGLYARAVRGINDLGPEGLKEFTGSLGKGSDAWGQARQFFGKRGMAEAEFDSLWSEIGWKTALENSGTALNAQEFERLTKIMPDKRDTPRTIIYKVMQRALAMQTILSRKEAIARGKALPTDFAKEDLTINTEKLARGLTNRILGGTKINPADVSVDLVSPEKSKSPTINQLKQRRLLREVEDFDAAMEQKKQQRSRGVIGGLLGK